MEMMNELLEKYFRAKTTLMEEDELKQYFQSDKIKPEHEMYKPLFTIFEEKGQELVDDPLKKVMPLQKKINRIWIKTFAYSGIAASIMLALWIQHPQLTEDYAIMNGKRINNPEYAQRIAENKMNKVTEILNRSMKPMQSFGKVRKSLLPMKRIMETREKNDYQQ